MKKELLSVAIIASFILTPCMGFAAENYTVQTTPQVPQYYNNGQTQYPLPVNSFQNQGYNGNFNYNYSQLQGNVIMVPANTSFTASTMMPISSETAKAGDSVTFYLASDFYYGNNLIAGAGSRINGTVLQARKGGLANRNGRIEIKFTNIVTPYGQMIPISARIQTDDGTGVLKAGTAKDSAKEYAKDIGVGAAAGAALGTAMGALSSGSVGKGAIYGTALGGGLGLSKTLIERGGNVEIPQGAQMNIVIDQPITISSNANNPY